MNSLRRAFFFLVIFWGLTAGSSSVAAAPEPATKPAGETRRNSRASRHLDSFLLESRKKHFWFGYFELTSFGAFQQNGGGYVVSPHIAWRPTVAFTEWFAVRADLGFTVLKNTNPSNRLFNVTQYQALLAFGIDEGVLELGGGLQNWSGNGGTNLLLSGGIGWPLEDEWLGFIDRIVLGYSLYFSSPYSTHEVKFGLGVAF